jgi:hypothetical protein
MEAILNQEPQNVRQIIANSFQACKTIYLKMLFFTIVFVLIPTAFQVATRDVFKSLVTYFYVGLIVNGLASCLFFAFFFHYANNIITNKNIGYRNSVSTAIRKFPACFIAGIIFYLLAYSSNMLIPWLPSLFPAIQPIYAFIFFTLFFTINTFFAVLLLFFIPNIVLNNNGALQSLINSAKLVHHNWWKTFLIVAVPILVLSLVDFIFGHMFSFYKTQALHSANPQNYNVLFQSEKLTTSLLYALFIPWIIAAILSQYYNLKSRINLIKQ